jgi:hypothetical protein
LEIALDARRDSTAVEPTVKKLLYLCIAVLFLLHQDFWFWNDATLVFGFVPVGLFYHVLYTFAASALMFALTRLAWPTHLEEEAHASAPPEG